MKKIKFGTTNEEVSAVVLGCMRLNGAKDPVKVIETAYENGITFIDHADIYGKGECETIFVESLAKTSIKREDLFIQSKCGIVPGVMFDFSKKHIIEAVEGSLQRLKTDHLIHYYYIVQILGWIRLRSMKLSNNYIKMEKSVTLV